jgi:hypothetical protein
MRNIGALGTLGWIVISAIACSSESDSSSGATGGAATTPTGGQIGTGGARPTGGNANSSGGSATGGAPATGGNSTGGVMGSSGKGGGATGGSATGGSSTSGTGGALTGTGGAGKGGSSGSAGAGNAGTAGVAGASGGSGGGASMTEKFSFFVTSLAGMRKLANSQDGFGGDLRFGEKTGLEGADKICRTLAEASMPGAGQKEWRAFLSTKSVNAADRLGDGPWYDRLGRLVAKTKSDLLQERPKGADSAIVEDLPNENGIPNGQDGCNGSDCPDNHDTLTGSKSNGMYDSASSTCDDWTNTEASGQPRIGHSWSAPSGKSWIQAHTAGGCKAGVQLEQMGGANGVPTVGAGGGYGGFYCFAMTP